MLTNDPNYSSHFAEYAIKLYNEVPKPLCKVNNYCKMIPKLTRNATRCNNHEALLHLTSL